MRLPPDLQVIVISRGHQVNVREVSREFRRVFDGTHWYKSTSIHPKRLTQRITHLDYDECLSAEVLKEAARMPQLRHLRGISRSPLDPQDPLVALPRLLPRLLALELEGALIHARGYEAISQMRCVVHLNLLRARVCDEDVRTLTQMQQLRGLNLAWTQVTDACLPALECLSHLTSLDVTCTSITDEGARSIARLHQLTVLGIGCIRVTDMGIEAVAQLPRLMSLSIERTQVTTCGIQAVVEIPNLKCLNVTHTHTNDYDAVLIATIPTLRVLHANWTWISVHGARAIVKCPTLVVFAVSGFRLTTSQIESLRRDGLVIK